MLSSILPLSFPWFFPPPPPPLLFGFPIFAYGTLLTYKCPSRRLNMDNIDLHSLFGLHVTWFAQLYSLSETPQRPPSPRIWTPITRALLVSKDSRHLCVTPTLHQESKFWEGLHYALRRQIQFLEINHKNSHIVFDKIWFSLLYEFELCTLSLS